MARRASRARAAAMGTKLDPRRRDDGAASRTAGAARHASPGSVVSAPVRGREGSSRDGLTRRVFLTVQAVLVVIPFAYLGMSGLLGTGGGAEGVQERLAQDPAFMIAFIGAFLQPFVAYLVRFVARHYEEGDDGYVAAVLAALLCAEMVLQSVVGIVGLGVLMWRTWARGSSAVGAWAREQGVSGVLAAISGALLVIVLGVFLLFAQARVG